MLRGATRVGRAHAARPGLTESRGKALLALVLGVYLLAFGMLVGVLIERIRFDRQRADVLGRYEQLVREWKTSRMALEKNAGDRDERRRDTHAPWTIRRTSSGPAGDRR